MAGGNSFFSPAGTGSSVRLLHTNDLHNQLRPLSSVGNYTGLGGFQKTAALIAGIKEKHDNVLLMDAGDISCGDTDRENEHNTIVQMMQACGYDAVLPGNRDYQAGPDFLHQQWNSSNISFINSNYRYSDNKVKNLHEPYKIVQKGNIKVGIIGAGINMQGLVASGFASTIQYTDPVNELSAIAAMLKKEKKCQLVVCLSHLGYKNEKAIDDLQLASQSSAIDVIIGGHSHTFMQAPQIVLNKQQQEVIINHAGFGGAVLGSIDIAFDDHGNKNMITVNNLMVGAPDNAWTRNHYTNATIS